MSGDPSTIGNTQAIYPRRKLKAIAARWDARAASWDDALEDPACHLNEDEAYARFIRLLQRLVAQRRRFCAGHGIIDAGCGTGLVLAEASSAFAWGIGIDISPKMIRAARGKHIVNTKFVVGDCFALPSLCSKAGAVVSRGVLLSHYGREQGQAILIAARAALVPRGFLFFDFLNDTARTKFRHAPENKTWFLAKEIQAMARHAGFRTATIMGKPHRRVRLLLARP